MKKFLAVLLVCVICFPTVVLASSSDVPTLIWWVCGGEPEDLAEGNKVISDYIEDKIGARLEIRIAGWGDFGERMNVLVNSGEYYDIMFTDSGSYDKFVKLGTFADITEMVPEVAPALWDFVPQDLWDGVLSGGKIYSVPTYKDSSMTQYWGFSDVVAAKYEIDTTGSITTLQDLDPIFREVKAGEGRSFYPINMNKEGWNGILFDYDDLAAGLPPLGVRVDDGERKVVNVFEQEEVLADFQLLHQWYVDGLINVDAAVINESPKLNSFINGQGWPGAEISWAINSGVRAFEIFPVDGPIYKTGSIQGSLNAIYAGSEHKEEALKFLELANTDHKLRDMLAYGIEGKHFEYVSDNVIRKLTDTWTLPGYQQATFFNMSIVEGGQLDQWEQVEALNESASSSEVLGFMFNREPVANEMANCLATWDKYKFELMTGTSNPHNAVPAMIAELNANGFGKIMEEAQRQIDEYFQ
ncbi:MAG: ABC transporter substrate-binding protein [Clostridiales bacterium]|jgi:putative aldouronate transport system substrate-binding protein|nr:ABC transporter substrate-binding protein [Clostridiales bacterium]